MVNPGLHPRFNITRFDDREQSIIRLLSTEWLITYHGGPLTLVSSQYSWFLMKPTDRFREMFNIDREIVVIFSAYKNFLPRTLDAFDAIDAELSQRYTLRVEPACRVLISGDPHVETIVSDLLKADPERPIVVPFTYEELSSSADTRKNNEFVSNRFRKHFYERDLFSFFSPLRKDIYFFGRSALLQEIVNRHRDGEHSGLFGLRKSGKTSIVYAVERHVATIRKDDMVFVSLDCESPSIHKCRWFNLLYVIAERYRDALGSRTKLDSGRYTELKAAQSFEHDVVEVYKSKKRKTLLMLFDEIEHLSPRTGASDHWAAGEDFVLFWQTLRGVFQRNQGIYTYVLVGTNPGCVEMVEVTSRAVPSKSWPNPLFASVHIRYVPCFDVSQVKEMVLKLGGYMGLRFTDELYALLVKDFGGHPFLIRQFCSKIYEACRGQRRPVLVDRALYGQVMDSFSGANASEYLGMIVGVLAHWYEDEYEMLRFLANGDNTSFDALASDPQLTSHLVDYGILMRSSHGFAFNIESLKYYLNRRHEFQRLNLTLEEKWAEISARRNKLEQSLRRLLQTALVSKYGTRKAREVVMRSLPQNRRDKLSATSVDQLLQKNGSPLFFQELKQIIEKEWSELFENIFEGYNKPSFSVMLDHINSLRADTHAKFVEDEDFDQFRLYMNKLEKTVGSYGL